MGFTSRPCGQFLGSDEWVTELCKLQLPDCGTKRTKRPHGIIICFKDMRGIKHLICTNCWPKELLLFLPLTILKSTNIRKRDCPHCTGVNTLATGYRSLELLRGLFFLQWPYMRMNVSFTLHRGETEAQKDYVTCLSLPGMELEKGFKPLHPASRVYTFNQQKLGQGLKLQNAC